MFTVLRRFSILMTMILEFYILKTRPRRLIIFAVLIMIFGAIVAASNDLAFDLTAYCFILANDLFTAANGVYTKNSLNRSDIGKYGLIFYNSLFSLPAVFVLVYVNGYGISHTTKKDADRLSANTLWLLDHEWSVSVLSNETNTLYVELRKLEN